MNYIISTLLGTVAGYCIWQIIHNLRMSKKYKEAQSVLDKLQKQVSDKASSFLDDRLTNPLVVAHNTLVNVLGMSQEKVLLYRKEQALAIAYGKSCIVVVEKPDEEHVAIGVAIDKHTDQGQKERDQEVEDLRKILEDCDFQESMFTMSLARLVVKLQKADSEKYSNISRQIHPNML